MIKIQTGMQKSNSAVSCTVGTTRHGTLQPTLPTMHDDLAGLTTSKAVAVLGFHHSYAMHNVSTRDVREWLSAFPFPPIPIPIF